MRIKSLTLENFKCFKKLDRLEFAKLTLLTGANSSGKSSILHSLLGALQTDNFPFYYSTFGRYVNMGDYKEVIFKHGDKLPMHIGLEFGDEKVELKIDARYDLNIRNKLPKLKFLSLHHETFSAEVARRTQYGYELHYRKLKKSEDSAQITKVIKSISRAFDDLPRRAKQKLSHKNWLKDYKTVRMKADSLEKLYYAIAKKGSIIFTNNVNYGSSLTTMINNNLNYISSFRIRPLRTYYLSKKDLKITWLGENWVDQMVEWEASKEPQFKKLKKVLNQLELCQELKTKILRGGRYEVLIKTLKKGVLSSLSDVGFGISQFLPIIVADLQLGKNSTLLVAQPEIHLHPPSQALYGNYLADQVQRENKNYIIETHSEYLLNRIRLLVTQGKIDNKNLRIYFFVNKNEGAKTYPIEFTKEGKILGAPKEFFDTYSTDILNIALNI